MQGTSGRGQNIVWSLGDEYQGINRFALPAQRFKQVLSGGAAEVGSAHIARRDVSAFDASAFADFANFFFAKPLFLGFKMVFMVRDSTNDASQTGTVNFNSCDNSPQEERQ
jgi:hypothetical protein